MTRALLAAAATMLAVLSPPAANAAAGPGEPVTTCGFTSLTHPFARERQLGYLGGATVAVNDGTELRTGRVTCALRRGDTHADPELASVTSLTTPGVVTVPETLVEYVLGPAEDFTVCLSVEVDGAGTFYWDGIAEAWSASPLVVCYDWTPRDPVFDAVFEVLEQQVDPAVCAALGGEDLYVGDVGGWDCPPYGSR